MSEKVKLRKEVADAIKELRKAGYTNYQIVFNLCRGIIPHGEFVKLENTDVDTLIRALYIGYEVEQTPEDKVREFWGSFALTNSSKDYYTGELVGEAIKDVLKMLNIKIEGVNA